MLEIVIIVVVGLALAFVITWRKAKSKKRAAVDLLAVILKPTSTVSTTRRDLAEALIGQSWDDTPMAVIGQGKQRLGVVGHAAAALHYGLGCPHHQPDVDVLANAVATLFAKYGSGAGSLTISAIDHEFVMVAGDRLKAMAE